jgi:hypothetical protein
LKASTKNAWQFLQVAQEEVTTLGQAYFPREHLHVPGKKDSRQGRQKTEKSPDFGDFFLPD